MKTLRGLKDKITFSEDDLNKYEIHIENNSYLWNPEKDSEVEFEITEGEVKLITDGLKKLDITGKITEQYLPLFEMFNIE